MKLQTLVLLIYAFSLFYSTNGISQLELFPGLKCSYNYDLEVHTHRGERSTKELNFKINVQVGVDVLKQDVSESDAYIISLHLSQPRIIRLNNGGRIKHAVDEDLGKKLSKPFFFLQNIRGNVSEVFFPHDDPPELVGLKKGIVSALNLNIHPGSHISSYSTEEEDDSGIHVTFYDVQERNTTDLHLTKQWSSEDYLKHANGRPIEGKQHSKSHYYASLQIKDGAINNARRTHFSYLSGDRPFNRLHSFQRQPDLQLKASGESHLKLVSCVSPKTQRMRRSSGNFHISLQNLKQDTLTYREMHHLKWSSIGDPKKVRRTFYELLRCYSDPSVKKSQLSQCVKELHYLARTDDKVFENIVNLTLERSHLNFSTWSALVGAIVVRGDYRTQQILSRIILTEEPRPLLNDEHAKILEAINFIPAGPIYPELLAALLSLHSNSSKSDEITVRAMLVGSALVRRCHDAGYNRSLSESIAKHLHQSFKTHPGRFHDKETHSHQEYIWSHICAFGNLGHISSLNLITKYLDHDNSDIRYFAVSALRKLPTQHTDEHLLRILRNDEHATVKAGVMEVFIERRQNLTHEISGAIEDTVWECDEGDELDSKITEFLENQDGQSHKTIKELQKRRNGIRRKKRALFPILKPRDFSLGIHKEWRRAFGGSQAGSEIIMRFLNEVKLRISIFGGSFEVNLDNLALFRAHMLKWSFDIVNGKAAFVMGAGFKNDIPKDIIHTIVDTADHFLANVDAVSSIFTQHIQSFLNKLKKYLPFNPGDFLNFISQSIQLVSRTNKVTRFGKIVKGIVTNLRTAWRASEFWSKIGDLVNKLSLYISKQHPSTGPFGEAFHFLHQLLDLSSQRRFTLPRNLPPNFSVKKFLAHINKPFQSTSNPAKDYIKRSGFSFPDNFFKMLHFKDTIDLIPTLNMFKMTTLRLVQFGSSFLDMFSIFQDIFAMDIPRLSFPDVALDFKDKNNVDKKNFQFDIPFDWKAKFKFKIEFSGPDIAKLKTLFSSLIEVFLNLKNPNVNFETFFIEFLPAFRNRFVFEQRFAYTSDSNVAKWLQLVIKDFQNLLRQFDWKLFEFSSTADFLGELSKITSDFPKAELGPVCKLQEFMSKSAESLGAFGKDREKDMIVGIRNVRKMTQQAIREVINVSLFVSEFMDELSQNVLSTASKFADQYLNAIEGSLEHVSKVEDILGDFVGKSKDKLTGLCYKTESLSGVILDTIQLQAQNAVDEIVGFVTANSKGIPSFINQFKVALKKMDNWYQQNFAKHVGKVALISKTIDELLSLVKTENRIFSDVHKVFSNINNVIQHLNNLPAHAQKAYDFADEVTDFTTNAKRWGTEFRKLVIRQEFKLHFDKQLRKLCDQFSSISENTIKHFSGRDLLKTFSGFIRKEIDSLISESVDNLKILKTPLEEARKGLEEMSSAAEEIEAIIIELRPFSKHFSPVLLEISSLPNCLDIYSLFHNATTRCGKEAISFGKEAYGEYRSLQSEVQAFLELLPEEWERLSSQNCILGGTCLANSLKMQAEIVSKIMEKLKRKFDNFEFADNLEVCGDMVKDVSQIFGKIMNIAKLTKEFSLKQEVRKIRQLSGIITGRVFGDANDDGQERHVKKRSSLEFVKIRKDMAEYTRKANETQKLITKLVEDVFRGLETVSRDNIEPFRAKIKSVQEQLNISFQLAKRSALITPVLQPLKRVVKTMVDFTQTCKNIVDPVKGTILNVLFKASDFVEIFEGTLKDYGSIVQKVSEELNALIGGVTSFLNSVQLRQKGLDIRDYKPWNQYQHCSADICLRLLRRSSQFYLNTIFLWKYPHLDDLSSYSKTGKWPVPGLFDDYKVRSIAQLSSNEMLLGMRGVAANAEKASLLVVTRISSSSSSSKVLKIIRLVKDGAPFKGDMGGVAVVKSLIWVSSGNSVSRVRLSDVRNSMSTKRPSTISIGKTKHLNHHVTSISYDDRENRIWILGHNEAKSYDVSPFGDILLEKDSVIVEKHSRGFSIVRQYGIKYACVAKCSLSAGYQCRLEFHKIDGEVLDKSTILREVRTPTGLEAVQTVDREHVVAAFSSATFSEKDKVQRIAGDFEDRYFKFKVPVLKTEFSITQNCLYFKLAFEWIIPRQRLIPFGEMKCGTRRKRHNLENVLDVDVYTEELEKRHIARVRRQAAEEAPCMWGIEGKPFTGSLPIVPELSYEISVFGIPVRFFFGADFHYYVNFRITLCLRDKEVRLAIIPGAWVSVYAGVSLPLLVVEVGITIDAKILEIFLIPELAVRIDKWPLNACTQLKMELTPLAIRVYLWYRFRLCPIIDYKPMFSIRIGPEWCGKNTFGEWSWSFGAIHKTLFDNCKRGMDSTRPNVGTCSAKQVGDKKYFIQWQGFTEDTSIKTYIVTVGSIIGSGDDHYSINGERQSLLVPNLEIMHGRSVYASVYAINGVGLKSDVAHCPEFIAKRRSPVVTFIYDGDDSVDLDYQWDATSIAMTYGFVGTFAELSSVRWGISSSTDCTLSESEADVLPLQNIGESYTVKKTAMNFTSGSKYYTRVIIVNQLGLATVACSDGMTIDITPPIPRNFTVGKGGTKFIPSVRRISAKLEHFVDYESPVTHYEWKIIDEITGVDVTSYTKIPLTQKMPLLDGLSLISGRKYTAVLKGTNAAGLYSVVNVSGIIPDDTAPVCDFVPRDVVDFSDVVDKDFVSRLTNITALFSCYDEETGIKSIEAGVGNYPGGANVHSFVDIKDLSLKVSEDQKSTWVTFVNLNITKLTRYHVTIIVENMLGYKNSFSSDGILIDTSPPSVISTYIRDGVQGIDMKYSKELNVFPAHWENAFSDSESGIGQYFVGLGSSPGLDDKSGFRSNNLSTKALLQSDHLDSGFIYYVTVIACNRVGMCVNGSSNGAIIDFIPPHTGVVIAGQRGPPLKVTWNNKASWARWQWCPVDRRGLSGSFNSCDASSFYDVHSGIRRFGLSVFSLGKTEMITPVKSVGRVVSAGLHSVMSNGVFSVVVHAEDRAGGTSHAISNSFIVDTTPPKIVKLYHGRENEQIIYTRTKGYRFKGFIEITEDISSIISYSVGVATFPKGDDIVPLRKYELNTSANVIRLNWTSENMHALINGGKYYITVKSSNAAGLFVISSSPPLVFDNEPPFVSHILDGWGIQDSQYHPFPNIYRMHWKGVSDISGINEIEVCLSSTVDENACNLNPKVKVPTSAMSYTFTNISLHSGVYCYAYLGMKDEAGNHGKYWSNGVLIDTSPPGKGRVTDGRGGKDIEYQSERNILYGSWSGFFENETNIHHYELAFGTSRTESNVQPFTNVGLVTSAPSSNLEISELSNGVVYYAQVVAYNVLGIRSDVAISDGVLFEITPPKFLSAVKEGTLSAFDLDYSNNLTSLSINWKCEDKESGLRRVLVGLGSQPGLQDIVPCRSILTYQTTYKFDGLNLKNGLSYYSTVKCINNMGLQSSKSSDGIVIDTTPPRLIYVYIEGKRSEGSPYVRLGSLITVNWKFKDFESHITVYTVYINNMLNNTRIVGPWNISSNQTTEYFYLRRGNFVHKERYEVSVTASNAAGLSTVGVTNTFTVDDTAPICPNLYDATLEGGRTNFSGLTSKLVLHADCDDVESGILNYEFAIKEVNTSRFIVPFHKVKRKLAPLVVIDGFGKQFLTLQHRGRFQVGVRVTNNVNLTRQYWSSGVTIDTTGPTFQRVAFSYNVFRDAFQISWNVFDSESGIKSLYWSLKPSQNHRSAVNFTEILPNTTKLVIPDTSFKLGETYYAYLKAVNYAGLPTLFVTNGIVMDRTPPTAGHVWADFVLPEDYDGNPNITNGASFPVKWDGFIDRESGVTSYKWALGPTNATIGLGDDFFTDIKFTGSINSFTIKDQIIHTDTVYYICIRVRNGVGLTSTNCSNAVKVKLGELTAGIVHDGPMEEDIDFQLDDKALWVHWSGFKDPVYGLKSYSWCYGLLTSTANDTFNCLSPMLRLDPPLQVSAHKFYNISLLEGLRYSAKVEAVNQRDKTVSTISDGFVVDRTAPRAGILDVGGSQTAGTIYLAGMSAPIISWSMYEDESSMEEFHFGIGTFPNCDDLLSFSTHNGSTYSLDMGDLNFNLSHGLAFYITIIGVNVLGLETKIVSPQIIVDAIPPIPGVIRDGNGTNDIDFQFEVDYIAATWDEFFDPESGVVEYLYCIGNGPDICNVLSQTSVDLDLHAKTRIALQYGRTYFVTVTAINAAGVSTSSSSNGVTIDASPPVVHGFSIKSTITVDEQPEDGNISSDVTVISTNIYNILASWDYIIDEESEIKRISACATTVENDCDLHTWINLIPGSRDFSLDFQKPLQSGIVLILKLQVENGAGLITMVNSSRVLIDSSPPFKGLVKIGDKDSLVLFNEDQPLHASWWGFHDFESGIKEYKWKICFTSKSSQCITDWVSVGLQTSVIVSNVGLGHGREYTFVIQAINFAGLKINAVSNSFVLDETSPEPGLVFNGRYLSEDQYYQSSVTVISASWMGFQDKESGISYYEICIGSAPGLCDVSGFINVGLVTSATASNLNLTHNATYYTTVRATNGVGQTAFAWSNGMLVDLTPPIGSKFRDGQGLDAEFSAQDMFISSNWDEFHDPESGISRYVVCAGTTKGSCDIVPQTTVKYSLAANLNVRPVISSGTVVYSTLWAYNRAGHATVVYSNGVLVDTTPPEAGNVVITWPSTTANTISKYLTSKESLCASWNHFNDAETPIVGYYFSLCLKMNRNYCPISRRNLHNKTSVCVKEPPFTEGEAYIVVITATNKVGLSSSSKSAHFIVDTTEPDVGEVIASNPLGEEYDFVSSSILARWKGFSDKESGISGYRICIGKEPGLCDVTEPVSVANISQHSWYNLSLVKNEEYFVSVRSLNNAGLFTDYIAADPIAVDTTAPLPFEIYDGSEDGIDFDYQQNRDRIFASWFEVEDLESDIVELSWCVGSLPGLCNRKENTLIDVASTNISAFLRPAADDGSKYFLTLTAVNGAGLITRMESDGITIDCTSPVEGIVVVGEKYKTKYLRSDDTVHAHWSGFNDTTSGIGSYKFALCEHSNRSACPQAFTNIDLETNITLSGLNLENGVGYVVMVRATDFVGLSVEATSNEFTIDDTPPVPGWVSIVSTAADFNMNQITTRWGNFYDPESELSYYEICFGRSEGECDEIDYQPVWLNTTHIFANLTLRHEEEYYATVKVSNRVGLTSTATSNGIKVDLTPPQPVRHMRGSSSSLDINGGSDTLFGSSNHEASGSETGSKIEISCSDDLIKATWWSHEDRESGISLTEWCIETHYGTCNVQIWEALPSNTLTASATIFSLPAVTSVVVVVRITNGVGNFVLLRSSQCRNEQVFPPQVNITISHQLTHTEPVSVYQTNTDLIIVSWSLPEDRALYSRVQAALAQYDQTLNTSMLNPATKWHGEPLVFDFVDLPSEKSNIVFSGSRLKPYIKYHPVVRLCNKVELCSDSTRDPIVIVPDSPPDIQINMTDTVEGTEKDRWQKYVAGIPRLPREYVEETLFVPDPFRVQIKAHLRKENETSLFNEHIPITYHANVYRVTYGANETTNVTIDSQHIFNDSHFYNDLSVCCSREKKLPQTVSPDREFLPVAKTSFLGVTVSALGSNLIVVSSQNAVYMFTIESLHIKLISYISIPSKENDSFVKVKTKNDTILAAVNGLLALQKQNYNELSSRSLMFYITHCNHSVSGPSENCPENSYWSSSKYVGREFAYDGNDVIAVSGKDPHGGFDVVGIFTDCCQSNSCRLHQVLRFGEEEFGTPYSIAVNHQFLVIAGSKVRIYSKGQYSLWRNETTLSDDLPQNFFISKTVYLTNQNELFILTKQTRTLHVFELGNSPKLAIKKCEYVFSEELELSGALDVSVSSVSVAAIGIRMDGRDGAELIVYETNEGCTKVGGVISKAESHSIYGVPGPSVAIAGNRLIIGTPGKDTWPTYVKEGTGTLYITTFCKRNYVRKKVFEADQKERVVCAPCGPNEKAYPGFEEQCINCSNSICLNKWSDARVKVSHCDSYPCIVQNNHTVTQNVSGDNLTVTESTQNYEDQSFYQQGSKRSYFIRLTQISATGLTKSSDSFPFSIDWTSPEAGMVLDGLGSDDSRNCSKNTTFGSKHQCKSRSFSDTDLDYTNNTNEISARWLDFQDEESSIAHYFWCVGSKPLHDDIMPCENATNHLNRTLRNLSLEHNDKYYVTVVVCNYAGLCTGKSSDGVLVDMTPPLMHYVRDGLVGPDIDYQVFTNVIFANWKAEDPESGVVSYEIGWGTEPGLDDVWEFQEIGNASRWYAKFDSGGLEKGHTFYVTVKAINRAGLESEPMTSNGITVGKTEFTFSKNDSGSFFFDTVNVDLNETRAETEIGNTFGTVNVPAGAVEDEIKFQMYSLGEKEIKNSTFQNTTVVDPQVVKPPKHFKLGDYSFQIKAYEPVNNTLQSHYHFKKPITITLVYDVEQMLKLNKRVVSNEVTNEDMDPVLLLWDAKNKTWLDAAQTCPKPWTYVDKAAKVLKLNICHLTQFALFWSFEAEYGIIEFRRTTNDSQHKLPSNAVIEEGNNVVYNPDRYGGAMSLEVDRYKGSTGAIKVTWSVIIEPKNLSSFNVSPSFGELEFSEGQWNSSIQLRFLSNISKADREVVIFVKLHNVSGGAILGKVTSMKITFPPAPGGNRVTIRERNNKSEKTDVILKIVLPCLTGVMLIGIIAAVIFPCRGRLIRQWNRNDSVRTNSIHTSSQYHSVQQAETSFTESDPL